jgi:uncharacterized membrane protein
VNHPPDKTEADSVSSRRSGYSFALFSSMSSAGSTVVGKWNLAHIQPLVMNGFIFSIATVILALVTLSSHGFKAAFKQSRQGWFWLAMFTAASWLAIWAFWAGVQKMDPSLAAFINRLEVLIAITLGIIFLGERLNRIEVLGAVISVIGIIVMKMTLRIEYSEGFWLVLIGSIFFGVTEFVSKVAVKHVEPVALAFVRNMFLAVMYWIVVLAAGISFDGIGRVWIGVMALGLLGPVMARMVYLLALKRLELSKVAVISQSQPVFVIIIALLALGQLPSVKEIYGGILLTTGCLIMILSRQLRRLKNSKGVS